MWRGRGARYMVAFWTERNAMECKAHLMQHEAWEKGKYLNRG